MLSADVAEGILSREVPTDGEANKTSKWKGVFSVVPVSTAQQYLGTSPSMTNITTVGNIIYVCDIIWTSNNVYIHGHQSGTLLNTHFHTPDRSDQFRSWNQPLHGLDHSGKIESWFAWSTIRRLRINRWRLSCAHVCLQGVGSARLAFFVKSFITANVGSGSRWSRSLTIS